MLRRKRHTLEEMVAKLGRATILEEKGLSVNSAADEIGIARTTYYRWRKKFARMSAQQIQRMLLLEYENGRLRRALLELEAESQRGVSRVADISSAIAGLIARAVGPSPRAKRQRTIINSQ